MRRGARLEPEAEADIRDAVTWYETQRLGLGSEFLAEVGRVLQTVETYPEGFPMIQGRTRRALVRRFPFALFYVVESTSIGVTACLHGHRDPQEWQRR